MRRKPEPTLSITDLSGISSDDDIGRTAVFFDFENIVLGIKNRFEPALVVKHLSSRGDVVLRRAYADWGRYERFQTDLLELGVEMVFLPSYGVRDKNRTDTAIACDAMEILFQQPDIETFVIISGDSDFGVLARKLRGYGKRIIGVAAQKSSSKILVAVCHEFIFYETLLGETVGGMPDAEQLVRQILPDVIDDYGSTIQPSLLKDRLRKQDSTFSERNYGFPTFLKFVRNFPKLFRVNTFRGGKTELTILTAGGNGDGGQGGDDELEDARDLVWDCLRDAGGGVTPRKLKSLLLAERSDFDERALGYANFTEFLRDQSDLVTITRKGRSHEVRLVK